jgi:DNA-directed RNA polymerase subunit RPC12/RpoP
MIQVSLTNLILLGMTAAVSMLTLFWMVAVIKQRRHEKMARQDLIHCRICGSIFENSAKLKVMHCPSCGSQNEAVRPSPI